MSGTLWLMLVLDIIGTIAFAMAAIYACFIVTTLLRLVAMKYDIHLPVL
jgi:uncharacterized membrane protein YeiH